MLCKNIFHKFEKNNATILKICLLICKIVKIKGDIVYEEI